MTSKHHTVEMSTDGVATLTIANAGKANILSSPVIEDLTSGLHTLSESPKLRALVLSSPAVDESIEAFGTGEPQRCMQNFFDEKSR